ncbi:VirK/YbjX family protein [Massilia sp. P8910]|uniref:VirK/YbjX family protein n=2 Tax=Massilia antarctica TaxID=2765360 RepID=UPI0009E741C7|nr:VirK/YbjX family protein [Massilia sp. H27-R4]MCE3602605.1 VirK/YbjX family protein [Massilia antarctica]MCY0914449.1 VirK/YbjX family protein [Massilia sp. H27-R4]
MNLQEGPFAGGLETSHLMPSITIRSGVSESLPARVYWRERLKLGTRALINRRITGQWLRVLNAHPVFCDLVRDTPRLLYKIYRPYMSNVLCADARLRVLASHYGFVFSRGLGPMIVAAARAGVPLGSVEGKTGTIYELQLRSVSVMEREGELVLQLCEGGTPVFSLAFTFAEEEAGTTVCIGCIQGPKGGDGLEAIRTATRELHGVRPKHLLVTLVRHLGHAFGCGRVRLVGNANRVVHGAIRRGKVLADYDQMWNELGAEPRPDGDFGISCEPVREPDMEQIQSKKRSEARKRHAVVLELADALVASMIKPVHG